MCWPALEALGKAARARTKARVVGVTGSVGKTSTKEMLRAILSGQGKTHAAEASYNNHWGVPLTLARMPVDTDFRGDRDRDEPPRRDRTIGPSGPLDVAMITIVAPAHLEAFASIDGIADEKASIFDGLVSRAGTAVFNADLPTTPILRAKALATVGIRWASAVPKGPTGVWSRLGSATRRRFAAPRGGGNRCFTRSHPPVAISR
jgi:UDP-N-acetylmuramoyl-tripeptide--D-alanyl-D-alanine ligase